MTYKNKLINILLYKNQMSGGIKLYTEEDLKEIGSWSEHKCKKVYNRIFFCIHRYDFPGMAVTCPWCQRHFYSLLLRQARCIGCGYGKRHGKCYKTSSFFHDKMLNFFLAHKELYKAITGGSFNG